MMTNNARHALVWQLTVHSATRTSSRTHHRNPGLDIRAIFEEGRENAKLVDCLFLEETVSVFITTACCWRMCKWHWVRVKLVSL